MSKLYCPLFLKFRNGVVHLALFLRFQKHSCRGRQFFFVLSGTPLKRILRKFASRKVEASRRPNYIRKTDFHCLPQTANRIKAVKKSLPVRQSWVAENKFHLACLDSAIFLI